MSVFKFSVRDENGAKITPKEMLAKYGPVDDIPDDSGGYFITNKGSLFVWAKGLFVHVEKEGNYYIVTAGGRFMRY